MPPFHFDPPRRVHVSSKHVSPDGSPARLLKIGKLFRALFRLRDVNIFLFVIIEVTRVSGSSALWQKRRFHLRLDNINK